MPTVTTNLTFTLNPYIPTDVCCPNCTGTVPQTFYLSNDHGFFPAVYTALFPSGFGWVARYPVSFAQAAATQADPGAVPGIGTTAPCVKPADADATDIVTITATVFCPATVGGPWQIQYKTAAETVYHRILGKALSDHYCAFTGSTTVVSPFAVSDSPGCDPAQTFPAPATPWTGGGRNFTNIPDPGVTTMSV